MASLLFRHSRLRITEPDDFRDAASGICLSVDFQRRQLRSSRVDQFQTPQWALDFGEANVSTRVRGVLNEGLASFCLVRGPGDSRWNCQEGLPGSLLLLPPGGELDGHTEPGFSWLTAAIPSAIWERCLSVAGADQRPMKNLTACRLPPSFLVHVSQRLQELRRLLNSAAHGSLTPQHSQEIASFVEDCFATACEIAAAPGPLRASILNRARLARRADAWMRDHLEESFQIPDVCLALGVSRRELEYAFRSTFEQSPRDHLQALRLNAIRRALLKADAEHNTVIQIAHEHGVTHLSRFASHYHALFGEKPGETLRG